MRLNALSLMNEIWNWKEFSLWKFYSTVFRLIDPVILYGILGAYNGLKNVYFNENLLSCIWSTAGQKTTPYPWKRNEYGGLRCMYYVKQFIVSFCGIYLQFNLYFISAADRYMYIRVTALIFARNFFTAF